MFVTKKALSRRKVLQGMGTALALPLLDAMVPAATALAQTAATPVRRLGGVYLPMGAVMANWTPATAGSDFEFSPILKPLEAFRHSLVVVTNLDRPNVGSHAVSAAHFLTGSVPKRTEAEDVRAGTSIDQIVARQIGKETKFSSLELAVEDVTGYLGACDAGYSCAYQNTLSWSSSTTPVPMETNPRAVFERLFGGTDSAERRRRRKVEDESILDSIQADLGELRRRVGPSDRMRLDEYLDHVREIERRLQTAENHASLNVTSPEAPLGIPESWEEHVGLLFDMAAVAYQADLARVFTLMMAREFSQKIYPEVGVTVPHHVLSHHKNNPESLVKLSAVQTNFVAQFAKFLEKLHATPDGDGSLLDHSVLLFGSGMSDSDQHSPFDLPVLVAGGGAGLIEGNRHLVAPKGTPLANVWLDVANKFGASLDSFGVSTEPFRL
jgi:hypothetical protein